MKQLSFLSFITVFVFAAGCASPRSLAPTTCKLDERQMSSETCKEGSTDCFVCRSGKMGNVKQIMECRGGKWVEKGNCGNCLW